MIKKPSSYYQINTHMVEYIKLLLLSHLKLVQWGHLNGIEKKWHSSDIFFNAIQQLNREFMLF